MTPKEKASELIEKYVDIQTDLEELTNFYWEYAKKCALIAVENEYKSNRELIYNLRSCGMIQNDKVYLARLQGLIDEEEEVKQEIEKL